MDVGDPGGPARWPRPVVRPGASPVGPARWSNRDVRPLALGACPSGPLRPCPSGPLALCASALRRYDRPRSSPRWFPAPLRLAVAAPPGVGWACPPGLAVAAPPGVGWACPPGLGVCCPARGRLGLSSRSPGLPLSPCRLHSLGLARHLRPPSAYSPGPIAWCAALRAYRLVSLACRAIVLLAAHTQRPPPKGQRPMLLRCAQPQESGDHAVRVLERRARAHPGSAQEGVRGVRAPPVCPMPAAGAWAYRRCAPAPGATVARAMRVERQLASPPAIIRTAG